MPGRLLSPALAWWQQATIYQIYPRSFQDSNGDGIGDLPGLIHRVDYLSWLGIDAVWLSPVYRSPMADFGYDISDFTGIDPSFGTLDDFDRLVAALHAHGIRLILDVVPNHTSDQHPWFVESRASRTSAKRDWYLWRDPAPDGGPPNSWLSRFGGSAWTWDEATGQYYYHAFLEEQPDLEWHNPAVRAAFSEVLRFWLARGVDGFRIDASAVLAEDPLLRDDPPNPSFSDKVPPPERYRRVFTDGRPETLDYLAEMRRTVDEFPDRVLAGEVQGATERIGRFYGEASAPRFHLPLNFALMDTPWEVRALSAAIDEYLNAIPEGHSPVWILGGHDKSRIVSRIGLARARVAALLLFTLPGTPFFYAGDEIGLADVEIPPDQVKDPFERLVPGYGLGRDPERAPMRWDATPNAGFTTGVPWLPVGSGVESCNVAAQRNEAGSMLALYRELIQLRKRLPALTAGKYLPWRNQGNVLLFERRHASARLLVAANIGAKPRRIEIGQARTIFSTMPDAREQGAGIWEVAGDQGMLFELLPD